MSSSSTGPTGSGPLDGSSADTGSHPTTSFPAASSSASGSAGGGSESWPGSLRDPDAPVTDRDTTTADEGRRRGGSHLTSIVLSLVLTPVALGLVDYSVVQGWPVDDAATLADRGSTALAGAAWIPMAVAAGLLLVVGFLGRASALGPLLAGLLWGAAPAVLMVLQPAEWGRLVGDLPQPWDRAGEGLLAVSPVFVVLGALLVGAGLAGRWRTRRPA